MAIAMATETDNPFTLGALVFSMLAPVCGLLADRDGNDATLQGSRDINMYQGTPIGLVGEYMSLFCTRRRQFICPRGTRVSP